jgi:hypothetical protein
MVPNSLLPSEADELLHRAAEELRQHLDTGQDYHAETVLSAFSSLASDPSRALELIVLEFQYRKQLGQNPQPSEWYQRFPHWREQLQARLEGTPPEGVADAKQETVAVQTAPYFDAQQLTAVELEVEFPILGRHEILEEIDRGGMGVVYRARDLVLDRVVALKVIRSGSFASADEVRRFYREARAAAQLRHPNIVPIYGMGLCEQQHCFTMALFPRGSLMRHLADYRTDARGAVALLVKIARAVQEAHERGIIHRDLKPGNILLDERGEPAVSDFGLAKRVDVSATLTQPSHAVGTPAYMSPEQVRCEEATALSDVWSLGVILYELLTGSRPFAGNAADDVKQQIVHSDVVSPRRLRPDLPRDLETIVLACLEKDPVRRYPSAAALADDLERWQRGEAIQARPESRWHRLRRQFRRRVGMKGVMLLLIGLMLMGAAATGVWGIFSYYSPEAQAERALKAMQRDLAAGKPVTLIGETGPPKWYGSRINKNAQLSLSMQPDKPFVFSDVGIGLLELLPHPKRQHYRFSAEVRNGDNHPIIPESAQFGIFFGACEQQTPLGPEQCCYVFCFGPINRTMFMRVCCLHCLDPQFTDNWSKICNSNLLVQRLPPPPPDGWHKLAVEVAPDRFVAYFDGGRVGEFPFWQGELLQNHHDWWTKALGVSPPPPPAACALLGALGLYVEKDSADFRNVAVEPLAEN